MINSIERGYNAEADVDNCMLLFKDIGLSDLQRARLEPAVKGALGRGVGYAVIARAIGHILSEGSVDIARLNAPVSRDLFERINSMISLISAQSDPKPNN